MGVSLMTKGEREEPGKWLCFRLQLIVLMSEDEVRLQALVTAFGNPGRKYNLNVM